MSPDCRQTQEYFLGFLHFNVFAKKKTINLFKVKSLLGLNLYSSIPNFFFELDDYIKIAGFFACLVINLKLCHHSSLLLIIFNNLFYPVSP